MTKTTKDHISTARMEELKAMASGLYGTIVGLTNDPFEGITLITMIHLHIWMDCRAPEYDTATMLKDYSENFAMNCEANDAKHRREMN